VQREFLEQVAVYFAIACLAVGAFLIFYSEEQWQFVKEFGLVDLKRVDVFPLRSAGIVVIVLGLGLALLVLAVLSLDRTSGESNG
jgi:ABC-type branched-subunit amino acid transport system permease subunit